MAPSNPPARMFLTADPPQRVTSPEAPTTATERGASTASRSGVNARAGAGSADAGDSTIRASAATGSAPRMSSGFTSISAMPGWSAAMRATASRTAFELVAVHGRLAAERAQQAPCRG